MPLHNRINKRELKQKLQESDEKRVTISFYKYYHLRNPQFFRDFLYASWEPLRVFGRVYVAREGINAQISVPEENLDALREQMDTITFLRGIRLNIAVDDDGKSFALLKIKVRPKIVADGLNDETFDVTNKGVHVDAARFNELANDPNTVILDMRNHYESEVGHFEGAVCPDVDTFRDSLPIIEEMIAEHKEDKKLLMYCTGGIRCEKASAYFKHKGFQHVYQLEGGIINYAKQIKENDLENKFLGKNFVFDERLSERIGKEIISHCHQCGEPADTHTNCKNLACNLLFIQCERCAEKYEGCCSRGCQSVIQLPEEEQKLLRRQKRREADQTRVFRKGRKLKEGTLSKPLEVSDLKRPLRPTKAETWLQTGDEPR